MERYCDLHTHSVFSDGSLTPTELIRAARKAGLSTLALTDHNTADGLPEFLSAAEISGIEAIAGAEFSVDLDGTELHLLGLFIPREYFGQIEERMRKVLSRKEESNRDLIAALAEDGMVLDYDELCRKTPKGRINRAHVAMALTERGYTPSAKQAFSTLLSPEAGYYREPERLSVWEMLDFLRSIRAVPVLAHPFLNLSPERLSAFLPEAKKKGLVGMECYYSTYDEETTALALRMVAEVGLKPSGGSDFHGALKPDIRLGVGRGNLKIPYEWACDLRQV